MANYPIVRLDRIAASDGGNIESVQHTADMPNSSFVFTGALVANERELFQVAVPTSPAINTTEVLLVASPEVNYLPGTNLQDFTNPANIPARAYHLRAGDIFTISDDGIDGSTVVGQWVAPQASLRLIASATLPVTQFIGKVIEKTTLGFAKKAATVIQVVKA